MIELPVYLLAANGPLGFAGYFLVKLVAYYGFVFIYALSQRFSAAVVFGRGRMNACLIATLYASAFWPLVVLQNFEMIEFAVPFSTALKGNGNIFELLTRGQLVELTLSGLLATVLSIYLLSKFVQMARATHKVGRVRACMISFGTILVGTTTTLVVFEPIHKIFYGLDLPF
jgi:hypothetical protein